METCRRVEMSLSMIWIPSTPYYVDKSEAEWCGCAELWWEEQKEEQE